MHRILIISSVFLVGLIVGLNLSNGLLQSKEKLILTLQEFRTAANKTIEKQNENIELKDQYIEFLETEYIDYWKNAYETTLEEYSKLQKYFNSK